MTALDVALVLPNPPLPFGNAAARWYSVLLDGLVARGHRVHAFVACETSAERDQTEAALRDVDAEVRLYPYPSRTGLGSKMRTLREPYGYVFSPELRSDVKQRMAAGCDVLHLEQLWAGWVGWDHAERALLHIHYLFEIDLAQAPVLSTKDRMLRGVTGRAEQRLLRHYPTITTLTGRLTDRVQQLAPRAEVSTVPLGLNLAHYPYTERGPHDPPTVSLIGSFDWYPTVSGAVRLLERLWPEIKRRVPEARLQLVGRQARAQLSEYVDLPDVEIHEDVPEILPYFAAADVLLYAPARGSGMKVKVLEAMALGVPVVTTSEGVEGLPAKDGVDAGVADDDDGLIERTVRLLRDRAEWERVRSAGRRLVETACDPDLSVGLMEQRYAEIVSRSA